MDEEGVEKDGWAMVHVLYKEEFLNRYKGLTDALLDNPICLPSAIPSCMMWSRS